jgi:hypothetical protein
MRIPSIAGIELLAATAREVTETAADSRAFSQENFITVPPISFSLRNRRRGYFLVTVVRRRKKCGKKPENLGAVRKKPQQGVWKKRGRFPHREKSSTDINSESTIFSGELIRIWS